MNSIDKDKYCDCCRRIGFVYIEELKKAVCKEKYDKILEDRKQIILRNKNNEPRLS